MLWRYSGCICAIVSVMTGIPVKAADTAPGQIQGVTLPTICPTANGIVKLVDRYSVSPNYSHPDLITASIEGNKRLNQLYIGYSGQGLNRTPALWSLFTGNSGQSCTIQTLSVDNIANVSPALFELGNFSPDGKMISGKVQSFSLVTDPATQNDYSHLGGFGLSWIYPAGNSSDDFSGINPATISGIPTFSPWGGTEYRYISANLGIEEINKILPMGNNKYEFTGRVSVGDRCSIANTQGIPCNGSILLPKSTTFGAYLDTAKNTNAFTLPKVCTGSAENLVQVVDRHMINPLYSHPALLNSRADGIALKAFYVGYYYADSTKTTKLGAKIWAYYSGNGRKECYDRLLTITGLGNNLDSNIEVVEISADGRKIIGQVLAISRQSDLPYAGGFGLLWAPQKREISGPYQSCYCPLTHYYGQILGTPQVESNTQRYIPKNQGLESVNAIRRTVTGYEVIGKLSAGNRWTACTPDAVDATLCIPNPLLPKGNTFGIYVDIP